MNALADRPELDEDEVDAILTEALVAPLRDEEGRK
jgi:hypothetical protein